MGTGRLEAFSDGVLAIIITIMVLELKAPHHGDWASLRPLLPVFLSYALSFIYIGIYWNNHHHLFQATETVSGPILWANLHLLFWLSIVPFVTAWVGENHYTTQAVAAYGVVLIMAALAFTLLTTAIVRHEGPQSKMAAAIGRDLKGKISLSLYAAGIAASFIYPAAGIACYVMVAIIWFLPDPRIERRIGAS